MADTGNFTKEDYLAAAKQYGGVLEEPEDIQGTLEEPDLMQAHESSEPEMRSPHEEKQKYMDAAKQFGGTFEDTSLEYPFAEADTQIDMGIFSDIYGGVIERTKGRVEDVKGHIKRNAPSGNATPARALSDVIEQAPKSAFIAGGKTAMTASDFLFTTLGKTAKGLWNFGEYLSPETTSAMKEWGTEEVKGLAEAWGTIAESPVGEYTKKGVDATARTHNNLKNKYPEYYKNTENMKDGLEATAGYFSVYDTKNMVRDTKKLWNRSSPARIDNKIKADVQKTLPSIIKPKQSKVATPKARSMFYANVSKAMEDTVANKGTLQFKDEFGNIVNKLPENLDEATIATQQRLDSLFAEQDAIMQSSKIKIQTPESLIKVLDDFIENPSNKKYAPGAVSEAERLKELYTTQGFITATEIGDDLKKLNVSISSFYTDATAKNFHRVDLHKQVADTLRPELFRALSDEVAGSGKKVKDLRQMMRNHMQLQDDLNKATARMANASPISLIDTGTDILTSYQSVSAVGHLDPAMMAAAGTAKGVQKYEKWLLNPDRRIKELYSRVDDLYTDKLAYTPKSIAFQTVTGAHNGIKRKLNKMSKAKVLNPDDFDELSGIIQQVKRDLPFDLDTPTFIRKKRKLSDGSYQEFGAPPKSAKESAEFFEEQIDEILSIVQTKDGARLLSERLGREEKWGELLDEILRVPSTKRLPPGGQFTLVSEAEIAQKEAAEVVAKKLGMKQTPSTQTGGVTPKEVINRSGRQRGYIEDGVIDKRNR